MTTPFALAAFLDESGRIELGEVEVGTPGDGEVLIRVLAVGLCGSDIHWLEEGSIGDAVVGSKLILGHEFSGVIESGPRSGQRVAVDPAIPCLGCPQCRLGQYNLCREMRFAGHGDTHGALRELMVWPERCLVPLPDEIPDEVGALMEPLGVALHAIDLAAPVSSESIGVIGCGAIGLLVIFALQAMGRTDVTATDPLRHRRDAAKMLGARTEPLASSESVDRYDIVFETAGDDAAVAAALERVRPGGRAVLVGIPPGDRTTLTVSTARRKELTLMWCRRMDPDDLGRAVDLASDRVDTLLPLITHEFALVETAEACEVLMRRQGIKVVVRSDATPTVRR